MKNATFKSFIAQNQFDWITRIWEEKRFSHCATVINIKCGIPICSYGNKKEVRGKNVP